MGSGASSSQIIAPDISTSDVINFKLLNFSNPEVKELPNFLDPSIRTREDLYLPVIWNLEKEVTRGSLGSRSTTIHYNQMRLSGNPKYQGFEKACGFQSFKAQKYRPYPFQNYYPFYLVPGQLIQSMTRLPSHEELLQEELLLQVYSIAIVEEGFDYESEAVNQCLKYELYQVTPSKPGGKMIYLHPESRIIFFSHRWEAHLDGSVTADNEDKTKLRKLKTIVKETDFVWLDYMCIPQSGNVEQQLKAIQSLPYYIARSHMLYVLTTDEENRRQYKSRAFPNLELLCASLPILETFTRQVNNGKFEEVVQLSPLAIIYDEAGEITGPFLSPHTAKITKTSDLSMMVLLLRRIMYYLQDLYHHSPDEARKLLDLILPGLPAFTDEDDVEDQYRQLKACAIDRFITWHLPLLNQPYRTSFTTNATSTASSRTASIAATEIEWRDLQGALEKIHISDKSPITPSHSSKKSIRKSLNGSKKK
eukprot:gene13174-14458_t